MEERQDTERGRVREVYGDKQYTSDGVYCLCCHGAWQFDALHCWTKDNSVNADSLAYLHIDYLWLP